MTNETKPAPATDGEVASKWAKEILGWSPRLKAATPGFIDAARGIMEKDARISADAETLRAKDEEIESLKSAHVAILKRDTATLRAQVETLRAALMNAAATLDGIRDAKPKEWEMGDQFEPWAKNRARFESERLRAALASTEPKG